MCATWQHEYNITSTNIGTFSRLYIFYLIMNLNLNLLFFFKIIFIFILLSYKNIYRRWTKGKDAYNVETMNDEFGCTFFWI